MKLWLVPRDLISRVRSSASANNVNAPSGQPCRGSRNNLSSLKVLCSTPTSLHSTHPLRLLLLLLACSSPKYKYPLLLFSSLAVSL
jgi:hypothetical protein